MAAVIKGRYAHIYGTRPFERAIACPVTHRMCLVSPVRRSADALAKCAFGLSVRGGLNGFWSLWLLARSTFCGMRLPTAMCRSNAPSFAPCGLLVGAYCFRDCRFRCGVWLGSHGASGTVDACCHPYSCGYTASADVCAYLRLCAARMRHRLPRGPLHAPCKAGPTVE